ncbi:RNA methyltransferase [soil metagenome]
MTHPPLSASNARLRELRKLSRRSVRAERRLFLADGPKAVEGALGLAGCAVEVLATRHGLDHYADLVAEAEAADVAVTVVDDRAMGGLSDAVSPAGILAVCNHFPAERTPPAPREEGLGLARRGLVAICADIRDPGNAGTVIRCADAAGADLVIFAGDSVDPYNSKTVRASVGSLFHLPIVIERDAQAAVRRAKEAGYLVLAADGGGEVDLYDADALLAKPTAWLFGNEAWGIPEDLKALADHVVSIPIWGRAESLNLSTAAAICLYQSARVQHTAANR